MYSTANLPRVPLPPPSDDVAALRHEVARLREALRQAQDENARYLRSIALWKEIALSCHGQIAGRLVHSEHKCGMLRFLLFSAWLKLGQKGEG